MNTLDFTNLKENTIHGDFIRSEERRVGKEC